MNEDVIVLKMLQKPNTSKIMHIEKDSNRYFVKKNQQIENLSKNLCSKLFNALSLKKCPIPQPNPNLQGASLSPLAAH